MFYSDGQAVIYKPIDSVLGETTLESILRVLDIPRYMLLPPVPPGDAAAAAGKSSRSAKAR